MNKSPFILYLDSPGIRNGGFFVCRTLVPSGQKLFLTEFTVNTTAMGNQILDIKSGKIFPFQFQILGGIFLIIGLSLVILNPLVSPLLLLPGIGLFAGRRGFEFDTDRNRYREYTAFLFVKFGGWREYHAAEMLYVNAANVSQQIYTQITVASTVRNVEYNAYLKLGDGTKLHLLSSRNKAALMRKLAEIAIFFRLEVVDNTI